MIDPSRADGSLGFPHLWSSMAPQRSWPIAGSFGAVKTVFFNRKDFFVEAKRKFSRSCSKKPGTKITFTCSSFLLSIQKPFKKHSPIIPKNVHKNSPKKKRKKKHVLRKTHPTKRGKKMPKNLFIPTPPVPIAASFFRASLLCSAVMRSPLDSNLDAERGAQVLGRRFCSTQRWVKLCCSTYVLCST